MRLTVTSPDSSLRVLKIYLIKTISSIIQKEPREMTVQTTSWREGAFSKRLTTATREMQADWLKMPTSRTWWSQNKNLCRNNYGNWIRVILTMERAELAQAFVALKEAMPNR